jgi:hypothetical protein
MLEESRVWGDQRHRGQPVVIHECAPQAQDSTYRRYRGLAKNANRLFATRTLVNLFMGPQEAIVLIAVVSFDSPRNMPIWRARGHQ